MDIEKETVENVALFAKEVCQMENVVGVYLVATGSRKNVLVDVVAVYNEEEKAELRQAIRLQQSIKPNENINLRFLSQPLTNYTKGHYAQDLVSGYVLKERHNELSELRKQCVLDGIKPFSDSYLASGGQLLIK